MLYVLCVVAYRTPLRWRSAFGGRGLANSASLRFGRWLKYFAPSQSLSYGATPKPNYAALCATPLGFALALVVAPRLRAQSICAYHPTRLLRSLVASPHRLTCPPPSHPTRPLVYHGAVFNYGYLWIKVLHSRLI